MSFINSITNLTEGEDISFDGKCLRVSKDKRLGKVGVYMMGAWASQNKLLLGHDINRLQLVTEPLLYLAMNLGF